MKRWRIWLLTILVVSACLARQTTAITLRPAQGGGGDKTLVSWVALADTKQRGGSALTIQIEGGRLVLPADGATLIAATKSVADDARPAPLHYHAAGMYHWDTWYLPLGDEVHMYHLQVKRPGSQRPNADGEAVGHAVSRDLLHWQEQPVALRKGPPGAYDDGCLFTEIYVDDVLALGFFLPQLKPGPVALVGRGEAAFKTVEYRSGLTDKPAR